MILAILTQCQSKPRPACTWKLYGVDSRAEALVRKQSGEQIKCGDASANDYVCLKQEDLANLLSCGK